MTSECGQREGWGDPAVLRMAFHLDRCDHRQAFARAFGSASTLKVWPPREYSATCVGLGCGEGYFLIATRNLGRLRQRAFSPQRIESRGSEQITSRMRPALAMERRGILHVELWRQSQIRGGRKIHRGHGRNWRIPTSQLTGLARATSLSRAQRDNKFQWKSLKWRRIAPK